MELKVKTQITRSNTILYSEIWGEMLSFYRDLLGLRVAEKTDWLVEFQLHENTYLSIADAHRATIKTAHGMGLTLSFKVDDLDGVYERLRASGVDTSEIKSIWGARAFFLHDPEGHRIEFWT
jgi:catechol 2,3-dioxygenase-like lactoylglutathione lyase family enzyme